MIGKILNNRYRIEDKIGEGGMSTVYKAQCSFLNRTVAIKVLKQELSEDYDFMRRFADEARSAASLSHPNIINIYDVGKEDNINYIVLEYIDGQDLKSYISKNAPLDIGTAIYLYRQILSALQHAHQQGIIHRDIKPQNIMLTKNNTIKVTDFGIAKAIGSSTIVHTGAIIGSAHYFSPEQAKGDIVDGASDLYSAGIILYEMLTGRVPFDGDNPISIALKHINDIPESPSVINNKIPLLVENIIMRSLAKNPRDRYRSITEIFNELDGKNTNATMNEKFNIPNGIDTTQVYSKDEIITADTKRSDNIQKKQNMPARKKQYKPIIWGFFSILLILLVSFVAFRFFFSGTDVPVPLLQGLSLEEAEKALDDVGLTLVIEREIENADSDPGTVLYQDIEAGTRVKNKTKINVVISKRGDKQKIPDLTGMSVADAEKELKKYDLTIGKTKEEFNEEYAEGAIISQDPTAGNNLVIDGKVNIVLSKGQEVKEFPMPTLMNLTVENAIEVIKQSNLVYGETRPDSNASYGAGIVTSQEPSPGDPVKDGTVVNIWANTGSDSTNSKDIKYTVPANIKTDQTVRFVLNDSRGSREIFRGIKKAGDIITLSIQWKGSNASIQVYSDDSLIDEISLN